MTWVKRIFLAIMVKAAKGTPRDMPNLFAKSSLLRHSNDKCCQILNKNALLFEIDQLVTRVWRKAKVRCPMDL
jgi:hypothetical protein